LKIVVSDHGMVPMASTQDIDSWEERKFSDGCLYEKKVSKNNGNVYVLASGSHKDHAAGFISSNKDMLKSPAVELGRVGNLVIEYLGAKHGQG
jgi:hypothetical protein